MRVIFDNGWLHITEHEGTLYIRKNPQGVVLKVEQTGPGLRVTASEGHFFEGSYQGAQVMVLEDNLSPQRSARY